MRNKNIDLIKCMALIFVIFVHSLIYTGFYQTTINHFDDLVYILLRAIFVNCVPLFLMATGYLMNKKEPNRKYYKSIIKIIVTYGVISIIETVVVKNQELSFRLIFNDFFNFSGASYSWYVNMYIGLFLLIPYMNILFKHLNKKERKGLIGSLIIMSSLTAFKIPGINSFLPNFWNLYPLIYYFLGYYIKEYNKKDKNDLRIFLLILLFNAMFNFIINYNSVFRNIQLNDYMSIFIIGTAYYLFKILLNCNLKNNRLIETLSIHSLTIYLISYIMDLHIYNKLEFINFNLLEMLVGGTLVLTTSTIIGIILDKIITIILDKTLHKAYDKIILK